MSPYKALFDKDPPSILPYVPGTAANDFVDVKLRGRDELLRILKENLQAAKSRMEHQANKMRRDLEFAVRNRVLLKL